MRVLHVIPAVSARYGGPSQAVLDLSRALGDQGIETLIATTDADGNGRLPVERERVIRYQGADVIFFRRDWSEAFKDSRGLSRWLGARVTEFDLVHVHAVFSHASLAAARACRAGGVPYLLRPLGSLAAWSLAQKPIRKLLFWHLGVRRMIDGAARVHYTSEAERRDAEATLGRSRGVVIPLAVDFEALAVPPGSDRNDAGGPFVLALGRLHPKKGLEILIDAFLDATKASRDLAPWRLRIAGDGDPAYVEQVRARARGDERVVFTGWLTGPVKARTIAAAALFASTSHQENFGLAAIEALGCGVPVLFGPGVDLADEAVAAGAGWKTELDRDSLRGALVEILRADEERARRGTAGRAWARARFDRATVGAQLAACYRAILDAPRAV